MTKDKINISSTIHIKTTGAVEKPRKEPKRKE